MVSSSSPATYVAFGLRVESELALPEFTAATAVLPTDVDITFAPVPEHLPDALHCGVRFETSRNKLLLKVDGVARFLIREGRHIEIDRSPETEEDEIRVFLLGSAFGALLHQRQDLVLHASAIAWKETGMVFMGPSGVGKSTTASAFRARGHAVLTDDLCVVRPDADGRMLAFPGFPQAKLWLDSLAKLELSADGLARIRNKIEKRALPLGSSFMPDPVPVARIYLLRPHNVDTIEISPTNGPRKFSILKNNTFRFGFLADIDGRSGHFQHALKLAQQCPLAVARRPSGGFQLDALVDTLIEDFDS